MNRATGQHTILRAVRLQIQRIYSTMASLFALTVLLSSPLAGAAEDGFSGGVTPSRFEIDANPGDVVRRSIEIYNLGKRPARFQVATVDWTYSPAGQIAYSQPLLPGSCRPWVKLEAREVEVVPDPRQPRAYRFEVHVPKDAEPAECRFALMVDSAVNAFTAEFGQTGIKMPVTGRLAVIVYLAIGGAEPELVIDTMAVRDVRGRMLPAVQVTNKGSAHGRLDSDLTSVDADGVSRALSVATSPILPGQTRFLVLNPATAEEPISYPLTVQGKLYAPNDTYGVDSVLKTPEP